MQLNSRPVFFSYLCIQFNWEVHYDEVKRALGEDLVLYTAKLTLGPLALSD